MAERDTATTRFTDEERAAMKERAKEMKTTARRSPRDRAAEAERDVLEKISEMEKPDREMAEKIHAIIKASAPDLMPRTWYGMPAYANPEGRPVVFFQDAGKFKYRYSTLGFQDTANLDDGDLWPVSYALQKWSPAVEKRVAELVKAAIS